MGNRGFTSEQDTRWRLALQTIHSHGNPSSPSILKQLKVDRQISVAMVQ